MTIFSDQFRKVLMRNKRIGYYLDVIGQSACLLINPIKGNNFVAIFKCMLVDWAPLGAFTFVA